MKKILLLATSALLLLAGCAKEMQGSKDLDGELQNVTFTAGIPGEIGTKAVADNDGNGVYVNRCIMEIYYGGELFARQYAKVTDNQAQFDIQLAANRTYKVAFWADCVAKVGVTPTAAELEIDQYYTTTNGLQAVAINGSYAGNSDARDAFALCREYTVVQQGSVFSAVLRRPFAQVNVITTDVATVAKVDALKPDYVNLTIKNAVTCYNVLDSTAVSGATADLTYTAAVYNWDATKAECTLSMDYIFAEKTKAVIDIAWNAKHGTDADISHSFANIPYQRNYRTNIKGALLTTTGQWNVTVDPIWEVDEDGEFDVAYTTVCDIAGANDFVANNTEKKEISVTFSSQPSDAGVPSASTGKNAIVTSLLAENATYNIDVASSNEVLYVGDYDYTTSGGTTTYNYETILPGTSEKTNSASVNLVVTNTQYIGTLVVNSPSKSVSINGQTLASGKTYHIENLTVEEVSMNTVIIESGMTVTNLVMKKGGLEIHGSVINVTIPESHGTILVRACENLSQAVYDKLAPYIATGYASQQGRTTTGLWDIYPAPYKIGEAYYGTLAAAVAAVPSNQETTITVVANDAITDRNVGAEITANKIVVLDLNGKTISHVIPNAADGATIRNKGTLTVKDGVGNGKITTTGTPDSDWLYGLYAIDNWKDITVKSGTIEFNGNGVRGLSFALSSGSYGSSTTTVIDGGTITSTDYCAFRVYYQQSGSHKVTVNDGTITGAASPIWYQICTDNPDIDMTINGGYITYNDNASKPNTCPIYIWAYNSGYDASKAKVSVKGGYFKGGSGVTTLIDWDETECAFTNVDKAVVSGGYFSALGTEEVAAGFQRVANSSSEYPWTVEAAPVCKIGSEYYYSLAEAVADVPETGEETTIEMLNNASNNDAGVVISSNQNVVLDLAGYTVSQVYNSAKTSYLIENNGTLTINDSKGNGKLTACSNKPDEQSVPGYASNTITNKGVLVVNAGTIENTSSSGAACYSIDNNNTVRNASLFVHGGTITRGCSQAMRMYCNSITNENNFTMDGGTIVGVYSGFWVHLPGSASSESPKANINISGGTITGETFSFYDYSYGQAWTNVDYTISGGTFNGEVFSYGADVDITGGTFNSNVCIKQVVASDISITGGRFVADAYCYSTNAHAFISGGLFAQEEDCSWTTQILTGYTKTANTDEETKTAYPWKVAEAPTVAKIGDVEYKSLEAAIEAVPDNGEETTVTLAGDMGSSDAWIEYAKTYAQQLVAGQNMKLDLAGHKIWAKTTVEKESCFLRVENGATLTIKDSGNDGAIYFLDGKADASCAIWCAGKFVMEGGLIENKTASSGTIGAAVDIHANEWGSSYYTNDTEFKMTGGTLKSNSDNTLRLYDSSQTGSGKVNIKADISGGAIYGKDAVFVMAQWTKQYVVGTGDIYMNNITLKISGGTFDTTNGIRVTGNVGETNNKEYKAIDIDVTGGTFTTTDTEKYRVKNVAFQETAGWTSTEASTANLRSYTDVTWSIQ